MNTAMMEFVVAKAGGLDGIRTLYFTEKFEELDSSMKSAGNSGILLLRDFLMQHVEGGDLEEFVKKVVVNVEIKVKGSRPGAAKPAPDSVPTVSGSAPQGTPAGSRANPGQNHGAGTAAPKATAAPVERPKRKYEGSKELIDRIRYIFLYRLEEDGKASASIIELMEYLGFPSYHYKSDDPRRGNDYSRLYMLIKNTYKNEFIRQHGPVGPDGCFIRYRYNMEANLGN